MLYHLHLTDGETEAGKQLTLGRWADEWKSWVLTLGGGILTLCPLTLSSPVAPERATVLGAVVRAGPGPCANNVAAAKGQKLRTLPLLSSLVARVA